MSIPFFAFVRRPVELLGDGPDRRGGGFRIGLVAALAAVAVGCDQPYADEPAIDPDAPVVRILSPARGSYLGDVSRVHVTGTVSDDSKLRAFTLNGQAVALDADGGFAAWLSISPTGTTLISAEAVDVDGNVGRETHAISAGPLAPLSTRIGDAVTVAISDTAFAAVGNVAASVLADSDLGAWIAPYNPVISAGAPDGPDCLYGKVAIGALDIRSAAIALAPTVDGLELVADLTGVAVPLHLDYAALCLDGSYDAAMTAANVHIAGRFTIAIEQGAFAIKLVQPQVRFDGFALDLGGVPGKVVTLLDLDRTLGTTLAWAVEKVAAPLLGKALAGVDGTTSTEVFGKTLDLVVAPAELSFSPVDAKVRLDTQVHVHGDEAGPGFVYVANQRPSMDASRGFQLALADDAANQLLASFWAARGMDLAIDLTTGDYGGLGKLYDRVETQGLLPLSMRASDGAIELVIPDLVVTFKNGEQVATQLAINGALSVSVERGGDGALRLSTGAPRVFVDILREGVDGANPLASSQFEVLTSFALARLSNVAAGLLGSIPLPSTPGASFQQIDVAGRGGYLVVDGTVE